MKPFEQTERVNEMVEAVYGLTADLNRGQILTHEAIAGVLNLRPHEGSWDHVVNRVRRRLENDRGIATWPDTTVGYRLCTVAEQLELPLRRLRRAARQARKGYRSVEALPEKSLSLHQRRLKAFLSERTKDTELQIKRDARAQEKQIRPTPVQPRKPAAV